VIVAGAISDDLPARRILGFLGGAALIFVMGVVDDRVDLSWFSKLLGQIVAAVLLLASDNTGGFVLTPGGLVLSLLWLVGLANALNFLDNMDGICAGISAVIAAAVAGLALLAGQPGTALLAIAVGGATLGYLRWNFPPAKIFLGDGGSLFLGYSLASLGLMTTRPMGFSIDLLIPVIALAYPIFDITFVSITRVSRGQSLTQGGRDHSTHRLNRVLGGPRATAAAVYAICAGLGGVALALQAIDFAPATFVAFLGVVFAFVGFGARLCRRAPVPEPGRTAPAAVS
jgi:UDP-GlcNAc:undecaprenyl-phosphate GlcNAc-1-phosphate transferase